MLTAKEEKFSVNVATGMTLTDAYKNAYNAENMKDETIYVKACELAKKDKIKVRIEQLRNEASNEAILNTIQKKLVLTNIIKSSNSDNDRMKAIDILNKMDGEYVTKIVGNVDVSYESKIKEVVDTDEY